MTQGRQVAAAKQAQDEAIGSLYVLYFNGL